MDPFLKRGASYKRLLNDYKSHGSIVVAYDFDGTVHDFHNTGDSFKRVISLLNRCRDAGFYMICFTANKDVDYVKMYLETVHIPFNSINKNPPFFKCETGKIYYNILLDDRAGLLQAYEDLQRLLYEIGY